jgi:hypothetical protein
MLVELQEAAVYDVIHILVCHVKTLCLSKKLNALMEGFYLTDATFQTQLSSKPHLEQKFYCSKMYFVFCETNFILKAQILKEYSICFEKCR